MPRTKKSGTTHRMEGLEQVRALSHPLRLRLIELFAECPRTTKQAAEALGEAPTRLYHHVAALERAGLIRLRETRQNRGTTEKYFEAVANRFTAGEPPAALFQKGAERTHAAMGFVVFDQARNELVRALGSRTADSPADPLMALRGVLRLSKREAKQLQKELMALLKRVQTRREAAERPGSRTRRGRYSLTIALLPTAEGGGEP